MKVVVRRRMATWAMWRASSLLGVEKLPIGVVRGVKSFKAIHWMSCEQAKKCVSTVIGAIKARTVQE